MIDNIDPAVAIDLFINANLKILYKNQYEKIAAETIDAVKNKKVNELYNMGKPTEQHLGTETDTWYLPTKMYTHPLFKNSLITRYGNKRYKRGVDIGFGMTTFFEFMKDVDDIILTDISSLYCEYATTKNIGRIVCGDLENLDFIEDKSCDLIICSDVLEHVLSLCNAISELNRISMPGCLLLINVPWNQKMVAHPYENNWLKLSAFTHLRRFDLDGIKYYFNNWKLIEAREIYEGDRFGWIRTANLILEK